MRTIVAAIFFLILMGPAQVGEASAAPVTYRYSGSCFSRARRQQIVVLSICRTATSFLDL